MKALMTKKYSFTEEWYQNLVDELKDLITEDVFLMRWKVIELKWKIGDTILAVREAREFSSQDQLLEYLSKDLKVSKTDLWYCIKFREKFESLEELQSRLPEGKNISWHKLVNDYINFEVPKPVIPVEEKFDEWGIIDWWQKQNGLKAIKIRSKKDPSLVLIIREYKSKEKRQPLPLKTAYQEIVNFYLDLKGWDKESLIREDYARMYKAVKSLLEKAHFDVEKVKAIILWVSKQDYIDWTLETCVKKFGDATRRVKK